MHHLTPFFLSSHSCCLLLLTCIYPSIHLPYIPYMSSMISVPSVILHVCSFSLHLLFIDPLLSCLPMWHFVSSSETSNPLLVWSSNHATHVSSMFECLDHIFVDHFQLSSSSSNQLSSSLFHLLSFKLGNLSNTLTGLLV